MNERIWWRAAVARNRWEAWVMVGSSTGTAGAGERALAASKPQPLARAAGSEVARRGPKPIVGQAHFLVSADFRRVVEASIVAYRQHVGPAPGLLDEVEQAFDGVRRPWLDQRPGGPPDRIEQRDGPSRSDLEQARCRWPGAKAADRDADAIVRDTVRPPGHATCTSLRQEGVAFGGGQRIAAPPGRRYEWAGRVARDGGPLRLGHEVAACRRRVMTRERERAAGRERPVR